MFFSYLKTALRNLYKQKIYTVINVTGLAIGLAGCLLMLLFVRYELSFDSFHEHSDRIYRVIQHERALTRAEENFASTPFPLAVTLSDNHPDVESFSRVFPMSRLIRRSESQTFQERVHFVDPALLTMFTFPLINGDAHSALDDPSNIVLTREMAIKYFGQEDPMGATLSMQYGSEYRNFTITGVAKDVPDNSSIKFDFLIPFSQLYNMISPAGMESWNSVATETYLLLKDEANIPDLENIFTEIVSEPYAQAFGPGLVRMILQPITDIHLNTTYTAGIEPVSDPRYSIILGSLALFVLLIACINFMILAVGHSVKRSKEVGMRKVMGATVHQLRIQFWGEALLLSAMAMILGMGIAEIFLPTFNTLSGLTLHFSYDIFTILYLLGLIILVGFVSGSYPAIVLSSFNPIQVLKGEIKVAGKITLRKILVIAQFTIAMFLISATLIMINQLRFLQNTSLGFNKEHVLILNIGGPPSQREQMLDLLRNELNDQPNIINLSGSSTIFGNTWARLGYTDNKDRYRVIYANTVDHEFIETMGIKLIDGRNFSRDIGSDITEGIIINEALAREYGWDEPVGQRLPGHRFNEHQILGVVQDFHFQSLHTSVEPMLLMLNFSSLRNGIQDVDAHYPDGINWISIRISPDNFTATLDLLKKTWGKIANNTPFEYSFLDDNIARQYIQEERLVSIAGYASVLAILIACFGLLGMSILTSGQRVKEIAIRKVLGANIFNITLMLSKDSVKLVIISFIVAVPLTFYFMNQWLEDFAYRIAISPWLHIVAGLLALTIALATVSWQAMKASLENPVRNLHGD